MAGHKEGKPVLGIDIGGTKFATALAIVQGEIIAREHNSTPAQSGPDTVIDSMFATIEKTISTRKLKASQLLGVGIAAAGISN